jgi:hypothetical protein
MNVIRKVSSVVGVLLDTNWSEWEIYWVIHSKVSFGQINLLIDTYLSQASQVPAEESELRRDLISKFCTLGTDTKRKAIH